MAAIPHFAQFITRMALGVGFILPVLDRLGILGAPGTAQVAWGDWPHFVDYTHTLIPFGNLFVAQTAALGATIAETLLGIGLIAGFKTKWMGLGTALITLTFALSMIASLGIGAPFQYPVFVFTGAGLLLSGLDNFKWSIDSYLKKA